VKSLLIENHIIKISVETVSVNGIDPLIEFHTNLSIEYLPGSCGIHETGRNILDDIS
jgi:hypothetical protein